MWIMESYSPPIHVIDHFFDLELKFRNQNGPCVTCDNPLSLSMGLLK
jgi:hypothetical protein